MAWLAVNAFESAQNELTLAVTLAEQTGRGRLAWECHGGLARVAAAVGDGAGKNNSEARARTIAEQIVKDLGGSGLLSNLTSDP